MKVQEIPVEDIRVLNRLRKVNEDKVDELVESIKQVQLLHPVVVAKKENYFLLLSGITRSRSVTIKRSMKKHVWGFPFRFCCWLGGPNSPKTRLKSSSPIISTLNPS